MPTTVPLAWRPLQRSTRVAILGALLAAVSYQLFLLDPVHRGPWWLWSATVAAEGLTVIHAVGTWWTILAHDDRPEPVDVAITRDKLRSGTEPPTIDVFVTAYGEPLDLLRRTIRAARDMRLRHDTWVLDDGRSDALADLCGREGVGYLRREDRRDAKAGNINAALARTTGEFVVVFDADHAPKPDFLLHLLPYFHDSDVAFVQSPQHYVNPVNLVSTGAAEAQRIFYELVCPGKNRFNAAFCVGTNVMFRRRALDEIGGIATGTNSEDIWTSLNLHRRGWRSVYVPQVLAEGLAPEDVDVYLKQQLRWAGGGFEVLLRGGLFRRGTGLTLDQRLQYLFVGTHYLLSLAMLTFMLLPAAYLLFGYSPIRSDGWDWATHYVPFYALTLLVTWLQSGGFRGSAIVTSLAAAPVHARALWATVRGKRATWNVTHRTSARVRSLRAVLPHVALLVLNVTAITVGLTVMADPPPTWLSAAWASAHVLVLGRVIAEPFTGHRTFTSSPGEASVNTTTTRRSRLRAALATARTVLVVVALLGGAIAGGTTIAVQRLHQRAFVALGPAVLTAEPVRVGVPELAVVTDVVVSAQRRVDAGQLLAIVQPTAPDPHGPAAPRAVRAPTAGTVLAVNTAVGGVAVPGQPLVTLYDQTRLTFQVEVPAERLRGLRIGMRASLRGTAVNHQIRATLDHVVPRVDGALGTDRLTVVLVPDAGALDAVQTLVPGLPFDVTVDTRTAAGTPPAVTSAG
jgi:cellulose synthase (UDP-forming)